jgi:hypothetical protein
MKTARLPRGFGGALILAEDLPAITSDAWQDAHRAVRAAWRARRARDPSADWREYAGQISGLANARRLLVRRARERLADTRVQERRRETERLEAVERYARAAPTRPWVPLSDEDLQAIANPPEPRFRRTGPHEHSADRGEWMGEALDEPYTDRKLASWGKPRYETTDRCGSAQALKLYPDEQFLQRTIWRLAKSCRHYRQRLSNLSPGVRPGRLQQDLDVWREDLARARAMLRELPGRTPRRVGDRQVAWRARLRELHAIWAADRERARGLPREEQRAALAVARAHWEDAVRTERARWDLARAREREERDEARARERADRYRRSRGPDGYVAEGMRAAASARVLGL